MRHNKKFNHLSRKVGHRRALLKNMSNSLIEHKRIETTLAKAKALRQYIEPLVTKAKEDSLHNRRVVFSYIQNKHAVTELFNTIGPKVADRPGGYTRVIKLGNRLGDGAEMAMIELVDFNEIYNPNEAKPKKTTRRRKKKTTAPAPEQVVEKVEETDSVPEQEMEKVEEPKKEEDND